MLTKRTTLILVGIAAALLAAIGVAVAAQSGGEEGITGSDAARVGTAALEVTGGGQVVAIERSDDRGGAWEVEILTGSREVDVTLDESLRPVAEEGERLEDHDDIYGDDDRPDQRLDESGAGAEELGRVARAARRAAGGGVVESVERSDDPGEFYEVEVVRDGREIDVALDRELRSVPNVRYDDDD